MAKSPSVSDGPPSLISVSSQGTPGNRSSEDAVVSADGRFVAFVSYADNLVSGDTNKAGDIFVRDRKLGTTTRVSVTSEGREADDGSEHPSISGDGRIVAFESDAADLAGEDKNSWRDVFVHDRKTRKTTCVSVTFDAAKGEWDSVDPAVSGDGRFVAFASWNRRIVPSDKNGWVDVFVHDRMTGKTSRVSVGEGGKESNGDSHSPGISANGQFVAFASAADNLVRNDANGRWDVFVYDRTTRRTCLVSLHPEGKPFRGDSVSPSISADGRFVAFECYGLCGVDVLVHDRTTGKTVHVSDPSKGLKSRSGRSYKLHPSISRDGRWVVFDSNDSTLVAGVEPRYSDIFLRDCRHLRTFYIGAFGGRLPVNAANVNPSISADGHVVVFQGDGTGLFAGSSKENIHIVARELRQTGR